jgi:uncharacterized protein (UPF0254 family)
MVTHSEAVGTTEFHDISWISWKLQEQSSVVNGIFVGDVTTWLGSASKLPST